MFNFAFPKFPHNVRNQVMKQYANDIDFLQQSVYGYKVIRLLCSDANTLRPCAHENASVRLRSQAGTDRRTDPFDGHILRGACIRDFESSRDGRVAEALRFHLYSFSKTCI